MLGLAAETASLDDNKLLISPKELAQLLAQKQKPRLIDVRNEMEYRMLHIEGAELATRPLIEEIFTRWPKNTPIVLYDHFGKSGLDAARALASQGFTLAKGLRGGIDAWSQEIDPLMPRY
jgi:adenylyltransferase/sulfurtransferase